MPRVKSFRQFVAEVDRAALIKELVRELRAPADGPQKQPLIYEEEVRQTKSLHVIVFWDKWSAVPKEERASIILDAYEQADPENAKRIMLAMGFTYEEAIDTNFLPFQIQTTIRQSDPVDRDAVRQAFIQEGAVQTSSGLQLRFPSAELADQAYRHLQEKFPGPYFQIAQTVARIED